MTGDTNDRRLVAPDSETIRRGLVKAGFGGIGLHLFDELESTSVWLREHADNLLVDEEALDTVAKPRADQPVSKPQLCATHWQTSGIARRGRGWQTRPGNITFSLLTESQRRPNELLGLSLVTGIGVATSIASECGIQPQLKWPNDVILNNAKVGGLLTEIMSGRPSNQSVESSRILTGIGINFLHDESVQGLGIGATSLEAAGIQATEHRRDELIGKLAGSVLTAHQLFFDAGWAPFAQQWKSFDWLIDKVVSIHREQSSEHAVARGVNEHGALLVERDGELQVLYGGEVSIRPISQGAECL